MEEEKKESFKQENKEETMFDQTLKTPAPDTLETSQEIDDSPSITPPQTDLERLERELEEANEKYVRLLAESENTRKRMQKEREDLTRYAVERTISEFLYPLDQFAKALSFKEHMSDEVRNWAIGFEMILGQFQGVLSQHGVTSFDSLGKKFDPHCHEAVETIETEDHPPGTILEESLKGYRMGERVLRPARVKVARLPKPPEPPSQNPAEEAKNNSVENNNISEESRYDQEEK